MATETMGVTVKFHRESWWIFINHRGKRKAKKVGDRAVAHELARQARRKLLTGDMGLNQPASDRFEDYAAR
jgi:hypothetical protein